MRPTAPRRRWSLLFDLTFVVAFSQVSSQMAHDLELGHVGTALLGFAFTMFGAAWAWINCSWLASAYDNDDLFFSIATLVEAYEFMLFLIYALMMGRLDPFHVWLFLGCVAALAAAVVAVAIDRRLAARGGDARGRARLAAGRVTPREAASAVCYRDRMPANRSWWPAF